MPVSAVVFDVGNVLYDWHPRYLYEKLIPDAAERAAFLRDVVTHEWHFQHDAGRPFAETAAELTARFPEHRELIAVWGPRFNESVSGPIVGMPDLVAELDARGVPLFAITNFSGEFWPAFRASEPATFDRFRDVVVSGDERMMKPAPAIYQLAMRRFGLVPGQALFVDDRAENVAGAETEGFAGHLFTGAPRLRACLTEIELLDS